MTRVAYLKRNVAGAMEDVAEDWSHSSPHLSSVEPGHQMLGAEEEKESNITRCPHLTTSSFSDSSKIRRLFIPSYDVSKQRPKRLAAT